MADISEREDLYPLVEDQLVARGFTFIPQFSIGKRRVDYFVTRKGRNHLMEVKLDFAQSVDDNIHQITRYKREYGKPVGLYICAPEYTKSDEAFREYKSNGIAPYPLVASKPLIEKMHELREIRACSRAGMRFAGLASFAGDVDMANSLRAHMQTKYLETILKWACRWQVNIFELNAYLSNDLPLFGIDKKEIEKLTAYIGTALMNNIAFWQSA